MTQIRGLIDWGGIEESTRLYVLGVCVCACGERENGDRVCVYVNRGCRCEECVCVCVRGQDRLDYPGV